MDDRSVVSAQIGRPARSGVNVAARCHLGLPVVIKMPPLLEDGTPFPTRYWLTCPLAARRIGRVEAAGGVKAAERRLAVDEGAARRHAAAMERYRADRDAELPATHQGPRPSGGVGGAATGVKCLHAHYGDYAAGNDNVVGGWTAPEVEPLDCVVPCVAATEAGIASNPDWSEPQL